MKEKKDLYYLLLYQKFLNSLVIFVLIMSILIYSSTRKVYKFGNHDIKFEYINDFFYKKCSINIVYCATMNHIKNIAYSSISIIQRTECNLNFYIFTPSPIEKVGSIFEKLEIESNGRVHFYYDIIEYKKCNSTFQNAWNYWNHYAFARIFMINSINVSKCIYLDTDVYSCDDIAELWNVNLGDNLIAGIPDSLPYYDFVGQEHFRVLNQIIKSNNLENGNDFLLTRKNYLNSGVLLLNIKELKKFKFEKKAIQSWNKNKTFFLDQDLFNLLVGKRRIVVDWRFNKIYPEPYAKCVLRHYNHIKVTDSTVKRHLFDYEFYYSAVDEYNRLMSKPLF